jgi:hypothetical protein
MCATVPTPPPDAESAQSDGTSGAGGAPATTGEPPNGDGPSTVPQGLVALFRDVIFAEKPVVFRRFLGSLFVGAALLAGLHLLGVPLPWSATPSAPTVVEQPPVERPSVIDTSAAPAPEAKSGGGEPGREPAPSEGGAGLGQSVEPAAPLP